VNGPGFSSPPSAATVAAAPAAARSAQVPPMTAGGTDIDTSRPHSARMYDYYLGGKDWYPVDQQAAEKVLAVLPTARDSAPTAASCSA
jgi:hypothetical protein